MKQTQELNITVFGTGRVASHLIKALHQTHHTIQCIYNRKGSSAATLAGAVNARYTSDLQQVPRSSDLYILAVSDDAIPEVLRSLPFKPENIIHTSGSLGMEVFSKMTENYGVMYPLQSFSFEKTIDFAGIPLYIEASNIQFLHTLNQFAGTLSENVKEMVSPQRKFMHLAAVISCNFTNHLFTITKNILDAQQLPFHDLKPLIKETVEKALLIGPEKAQTGPALRNDRKTMDEHLGLLKNHPGLKEMYQIMSRLIQEQAKKEQST